VARTTRVLVASLWIALIAVTGCGGGTAVPSEAHVVALANAVCRDYYERVSRASFGRPGNFKRLVADERARFRALLTPAASHPRVGTLLKDLAAREEVRSRMESPGMTQARREEFYRVSVRVYNDEKALGLSACTRKRPNILIIR
jgi:hypothetical protein